MCVCVRESMQYAYASPRGKFIQKYNAKRDGAHYDFNSPLGKIASDLTQLHWTLIFQKLTPCAQKHNRISEALYYYIMYIIRRKFYYTVRALRLYNILQQRRLILIGPT